MFERSEFFSTLKIFAERREPEGQGAGCLFSAYSLWASKESKLPPGAKPRDFDSQAFAKSSQVYCTPTLRIPSGRQAGEIT